MLLIDGGRGEAGGQIVRTAVGLSSLFLIPIRVINIRKGRSPPGLKNQHMYAIKLLEQVTNAETKGVKVGSLEIEFKPRELKDGKYEVDIGTAGSISLFLQCVLLPLIFAGKVELRIKGGTDVKWSPPIDYVKYVILPRLERFAEINLEVKRRGFYPKGGGIVEVKIKSKIKRKDFENYKEFLNYLREKVERYDEYDCGEIKEIKAFCVASKDLEKRRVAERMLEGALEILKDFKVKEKIEYVDSLSTGCVITLVAYGKTILGADALGEIGKKAEDVGKEAAQKLLREIKNRSGVDVHMADNLVPYLGLVGGRMRTSELSSHLLTNIETCKYFLGDIYKVDEKNKIIEC